MQDPEKPPSPSQSQSKAPSKSVLIGASFAGPLPPPGILKGYEEACPGAADRIIKMAEEQGRHRRQMEAEAMATSREAMRLGFLEGRIGQFCAVSVALAFIGAGVWIAKLGHPWTGTVLSASGVAVQALISAFIKKQYETKPSPPEATPKKRGRGKRR